MGNLHSGQRFDATSVSILPQFAPLTQCLTLDDISALAEKLRQLPTNAFLDLAEFRDWLHMGATFDTYALYLFESLKTSAASKKVYAMELLGGLTLTTPTSASPHAKVDLLCGLFTHPTARVLTESDVAVLLLSTIAGLKKLTFGLADLWKSSTTREMAKELLAAAWRDCGASDHVSRDALVAWALSCKATSYVVRHFIPGDLLNPLASAPIQAPPRVLQQRELYASILDALNPDESQRAEAHAKVAATTRIQAMFKCRMAKRQFERTREERAAHRHAAALKIQDYSKKQKAAQQLLARAALERAAFNGAVLSFGAGLGLGDGDTAAMRAAPRIVGSLRATGTKVAAIAMSSSTTFATATTGEVLAWGHGVPLATAAGTSLFTALPTRVGLKVAVQALACGRAHCLVLDADAFVYSWGFNDHGQTGHGAADVLYARSGRRYERYYDVRLGESADYLSIPEQLPYFTGRLEQAAARIPIVAIACGDYFSLALSADGEVYSWGEGSDGQLGHGTVDGHLEVGFVDRRLVQTAYTFTYEPMPISGLQDVVSIGCTGNRSAALTSDHRFYEWGSWGRMLGAELPPAYAPQSKHGVQQYALTKFALGLEHTIAEGASVWVSPANSDLECFVLMAQHGLTVDQMRAYETRMDMVVVDLDFDDCEATPDDAASLLGSEVSSSSLSAMTPRAYSPADASFSEAVDPPTEDSHTDTLPTTSGERLLRSPSAIHSTINALIHKLWRNRCVEVQPTMEQLLAHPTLVPLRWCRAVKDGSLNYQALLDEVLTDISGHVLLMPMAPPAGFYLQLFTPEVVVLEIRGVPSNTCRMVTKRGIWSHVVDLTDIPSTSELEIDNSIVLARFTKDDLVVKIQHLREDTIVELITTSIAQKALTLQEYGVVCIVLAFDFDESPPFELVLPGDLGVYIPVLMIDMKQCGQLQATLRAHGTLSSRLFARADYTPVIIATALRLGATGVLLQQRAPTTTPSIDGDVCSSDAAVYRNVFDESQPPPLVGMVSYSHGQALRLGAHYDDDSNLLVAKVHFSVRRGGNLYAWGCATNGRLGVGAVDAVGSDLMDGYDPMTETTYRWTKEPTVVASLCGRGVVDFACGASHTVARTAGGRVFSWGRGSRGQLGHNDTKDVAVPKLVRRLAFENIVAVAASEACSTVLCEALDDEAYEQRRKEVTLLKAAHAKLPPRL
ncbi:regulator of chromosome condensation (RCC1) [Achlya hypogyna]|uniref:Regulator of chromosome condensation (RCC1) n=1 Tax=Achlya hypogyna TaxID=1202772 RepID=A0A1V9ZT13_ACHHY|nr:regulator of chromosome condensation (RCC1) [Achlya hypogyna]